MTLPPSHVATTYLSAQEDAYQKLRTARGAPGQPGVGRGPCAARGRDRREPQPDRCPAACQAFPVPRPGCARSGRGCWI